MRGLRQILGGVLVLTLLALLLTRPSSAQVLTGSERAQLEAEKQGLFNQTLNTPTDLQITLRYAEVSALLGDNEAAVAALERLLLFNPNLPRVNLELGALYFRMGSFEMARTYFKKALSSNPPFEIKERANAYLVEIDRQLQPDHLTGSLFSGIQYQSDANLASGSSLINSPLGLVPLNSQYVKGADGSIFGSSTVLYSHDLGDQYGDTLEATAATFVNHYFRFNRLDLDFIEVTAGPRFNALASAGNEIKFSFKPYTILNEVGLGEDQYFFTYGAGTEWTAAIFDDFSLRALLEYRQKRYSNSPDRPLSSGLSGSDKTVSLQAVKPISSISDLSGQFDYLYESTELNYYSNQAYAGTVAYHLHYDDPTGTFALPLETNFYLTRIWDFYNGQDPCCNTSSSPATNISFSTRYDRHWRFGVSQTVRVLDNLSVVLQFQRDILSSNLPLYAYTSNSVLLGPRLQF